MLRNDLALRLASSGLAVQPIDKRTGKALGPATADTKEVRKIWSGRNSPFINLVGANEECKFLIEDAAPDLKDINPVIRPVVEKVLIDQQKWCAEDDRAGFGEPRSMADLWDKEVPEVQWLMDGFLPRDKVIVLAGWRGIGKSRLVLSLCMHVAAGKPWFGHDTKEGKVVYLSAEDDEDDVDRRVQPVVHAMGETYGKKALGNFLTWDFVGKFAPLIEGEKWGSTPTGVADQIAETIGDADLIVIDTLSRFHSASENDSSAMSQLMNAIESIKRQTNATILVISHTGKGDQSTVRGSSAIESSARGVIMVERLTEDQAKNKLLDPAGHYLDVRVSKMNCAIDDSRLLLQSITDGFVECNTDMIMKAALKNLFLEWNDAGKPLFSLKKMSWSVSLNERSSHTKKVLEYGKDKGLLVVSKNKQLEFVHDFLVKIDGKD